MLTFACVRLRSHLFANLRYVRLSPLCSHVSVVFVDLRCDRQSPLFSSLSLRMTLYRRLRSTLQIVYCRIRTPVSVIYVEVSDDRWLPNWLINHRLFLSRKWQGSIFNITRPAINRLVLGFKSCYINQQYSSIVTCNIHLYLSAFTTSYLPFSR